MTTTTEVYTPLKQPKDYDSFIKEHTRQMKEDRCQRKLNTAAQTTENDSIRKVLNFDNLEHLYYQASPYNLEDAAVKDFDNLELSLTNIGNTFDGPRLDKSKSCILRLRAQGD